MESDPERIARGLLPAEEHAARPERPAGPDSERASPRRAAAVAALLRLKAKSPEVLLIRRAQRPDDRWSGQIAMPGGRTEPDDADLVATAVREFHEEVGVDLARSARLLGALPTIRARARGRILPFPITPFVFVCTEEVEPTTSPEVDEVFWFPLARAASGELRWSHRHREGSLVFARPAWRYEKRVIWGLTHRMLSTLIERGGG